MLDELHKNFYKCEVIGKRCMYSKCYKDIKHNGECLSGMIKLDRKQFDLFGNEIKPKERMKPDLKSKKFDKIEQKKLSYLI